MKVLSLFDGMSCGMIALKRLSIPVTAYYASEIDKYAITVSAKNHPEIIRLGDVQNWREWDIDWGSIDLILGGFPCQAWSMAGKQLGDKDERGQLFWTMLDIMKEVRAYNPKADFLIENVKMKKEFEQYITHHTEQALGNVHKILINSALVSAQNRNRYYWTSFPTSQPNDKGIQLVDIIDESVDNITMMSDSFCSRNKNILRDDLSGKSKTLTALEYAKNGRQGDYISCKSALESQLTFATIGSSNHRVFRKTSKAGCLTAIMFKGVRAAGRPLIANKDCIGVHIDKCNQLKEIRCGAIRGRKASGDAKYTQTVELRGDDKTNSITTVQKDNVICSFNRKDGIGKELEKAYPLNATDWRGLNRNQNQNCVVIRPASLVGRRLNEKGCREDYNKSVPITQCLQVKHKNEKMGCLTTVQKDTLLSTLEPGRYPDNKNVSLSYRKLTPIECERLQTVPDGYTEGVSNTQRYKMLGNGWTVDVIVHLLSSMLLAKTQSSAA